MMNNNLSDGENLINLLLHKELHALNFILQIMNKICILLIFFGIILNSCSDKHMKATPEEYDQCIAPWLGTQDYKVCQECRATKNEESCTTCTSIGSPQGQCSTIRFKERHKVVGSIMSIIEIPFIIFIVIPVSIIACITGNCPNV